MTALLMTLAAVWMSQADSAVRGVVRDQTGAVLPGAKVERLVDGNAAATDGHRRDRHVPRRSARGAYAAWSVSVAPGAQVKPVKG